MQTARLLLVEDDQDTLEVLTVMLGEKYRVLGCRQAAEALSAVEAAKPNLLVLDIRMNPVDGLQCLRAIRAIPGFGRIPAIALTALARNVDREAFLAAGFQTVVTKPVFDPEELFAAISSLLTSGPAPTPEPPAEDTVGDQSSVTRRALTAPANGPMMTAYGWGRASRPEPA